MQKSLDASDQRSQSSAEPVDVPDVSQAGLSISIKGAASLKEERRLRHLVDKLEAEMTVAKDLNHSLRDNRDDLKADNARLRRERDEASQSYDDAVQRYQELYDRAQHDILREQETSKIIIDEKDALIQHLQDRVKWQTEIMHRQEDKLKLRQEAAVDDLKMDDFDNSIDRVSESDLISRLENVDSCIDEFVTELLEMFSNLPHVASTDWIRGPIPPGSSPLLKAALTVETNSEEWGMLVDAYMHQQLVAWLYASVSSPYGLPTTYSYFDTVEQINAEVTRTGKSPSRISYISLTFRQRVGDPLNAGDQ
jgi:hypothetical protein